MRDAAEIGMAPALFHLSWRRSDVHPKQRTYALLAAVVFAAAAAFEIARAVLGLPWRNVPPQLSSGIGVLLSALWLSAAAGLLLRERSSRWLTWGFFLSLTGALAFVAHGAVTRVFGSLPGALYIVLAFIQLALLKAAFDRGFLQTGIDAGRVAQSH